MKIQVPTLQQNKKEYCNSRGNLENVIEISKLFNQPKEKCY